MPVSKNTRRKKAKKQTKPVNRPSSGNDFTFDDETEIAPNVFAFGFPPELDTFSNEEAFGLLNSHAVYVELAESGNYHTEDIAIVVGMLVLNDETEIILKTNDKGLLQLRKSTFFKNFALLNMDF
ncbi:hypothetical protein [Catenovulum adriaticum]|uniref:Uncharacterized protein n=1 Tax=Catenovulum adriaticum TaxID=2984846 RepID=A0ABY7AJM7_9ALTE|nr:hypothetical protein [Catenovulum sp. TS8]WAJ69734.1 hypothetical protein OLW01_11295 [Catenovulum sp. TS8]